jgi:hypothetical protein
MQITADFLSGLVKWLARDHWRDAFQEVIGEHFGEFCEEAGIETFDELADIIGDHWFNVLWGCAFEDFLTRETENGNIVDDYLKRRGWNEKAMNKAYMTALRTSVMSLYEVSDIRRGESFLARDLVRGGESIRVQEGSATKTLKQWDRAAMRIVEVRGRTMISGGLLPFEPDLSEEALDHVRHLIDSAPMAVGEMFDALGAEPSEDEIENFAVDLAMHSAAPIFTSTWLDEYLVQEPELPTLVNADGEEMVFIQLHYRLNKGVTQKQVRAALDASPELDPASVRFWNWLQPADAAAPARSPQSGVQMSSAMPDGSVVLGTLELKGRRLEAQVNSESRAQRATAMLAPLLEGLVAPPLMARQTLEQTMAAHREAPATPKPSGLSPEEEREAIHQVLDRQYRAVLDEPVPMLDDMTPRSAARSKKDREKLVAWLKYLENRTARLGEDNPMATYDFTWMWEELGVAKLRC